MKIRKIKVDGFGHFRHFELSLSPGLNVLHGPNEAGKSTLLAFVRSILFGFERRADLARYEPDDGPYGGELQLDTHFGPITVRRVGSKRRYDGELSLRGVNGEPLPESKLVDALGGTTRELFYRVFAFGLDELASFEELASQGSVSEALFAAGMLGAQRLPGVLEGLRKESEGLYAPRGTKKELNVVLNDLQELQGQLRELGDRPAHYQKHSAELPRLESVLTNVEANLESSQRRMEQVDRLCSAAAELARLEVIRAELQALGDLKDFPEGGLERLEQLTVALSTARSERDEVLTESASVERLLAEMATEQGKALDAPRLKSAAEAFASRLHQFRSLPAKKATLAERRRQVDGALGGLGLSLDGARLAEMDLGAAAKMKLSSLRDQVADAKATWSQRDAAFRNARSAREHLEQEIRRLTNAVACLPSWPIEAVRGRQVSLRRVDPLRSESTALRATADQRRADVQAQRDQAAALLEPRPAFPGSLAAIICLVLLSLAAGIYVGRGPHEGLTAAGAAGALSLLLLWVQRQSAKSHVHAVQSVAQRKAAHDREVQRLLLDAELAERKARERWAEALACASEAGVEVEADEAALSQREEQLEQELNDVRQRQKLSIESEGLTPKLSLARTEEKNAEVDLNAAEAKISELERWVQEIYATLHFPAKLPVERALELWSEVASLRQRLLDVRSEEEGLNAEERECHVSARAVLDAAHEAGISAAGPEEALSGLSETLARAGEKAREQKQLQQRREELKVRKAKSDRGCAEFEAALERLMLQARAPDSEAFRKRAAAAVEYRRASSEARELNVKIESGCGQSVADVQAELRLLGGREGAVRELAVLRARVDALVEDRRRLADERGGLKKQLALWEADTEIARIRQKEEVLAGKAGDLAQRYAVDRLALLLLQRARETFEKDQQPRVVKLASALFAELSGGKYTRIFTSTEANGLVACEEAGKEWPAGKLSRGTREALYLAFRLAVIQDFAETRGPLPLLIDDILVNFDPERTFATLDLFSRVAERQQVIAFTCHSGVREDLAQRGASVLDVAPRQARLGGLQSA
ncbi:MAG: AAA family ATPase [Myxococcaceae bacterium]